MDDSSESKSGPKIVVSLRRRAQIASIVFSVVALIFFIHNLVVAFSAGTAMPQLLGIVYCLLLVLSEFKIPLPFDLDPNYALIQWAAFLARPWGKALSFFTLGCLMYHPDFSVSMCGSCLFWSLTMCYCALSVQLDATGSPPFRPANFATSEWKDGLAIA